MLLQLLRLDGLDADLNKNNGPLSPISEDSFQFQLEKKQEPRSLVWPVLAAEAAGTVEL